MAGSGFSYEAQAMADSGPALIDAAEAAQFAADPLPQLSTGSGKLDASLAAFQQAWGASSRDLSSATTSFAQAAVQALQVYEDTDGKLSQSAMPGALPTPTSGPTPGPPTPSSQPTVPSASPGPAPSPTPTP